MKRQALWLRSVAPGFVRALLLAVAAWIIPAVSLVPAGVSAWLGSAWSPTNPWSWVGVLVLFAGLTLIVARPVGSLFRRLAARWCDFSVPADYRRAEMAPKPVRLSTGYWWNGYSYEQSRRDAEMDQQWRRRMGDPAYWRDARWVVIAAVTVGPVCAVPPIALAAAVIGLAHPSAATVIAGVLLVLVAAATAPYVGQILGPLADRWLRLSERAATDERVRELELQRADLTASQAAEIGRIERDLHDGAQARLVAVGLSLATAEKLMDQDPAQAKALLREARQGTSNSLSQLRDLVHGINPPVLVERGVVAAIQALALDSPIQVEVDGPDRIRLDTPVGCALYFAVAELLANAAKHAPSARVQIHIRDTIGSVEIQVIDDGPGGAVVRPGSGLDGIGRRLAAFDGTLTVTSPAGGPTSARIVVPCGPS